jgi:hypothetical protein
MHVKLEYKSDLITHILGIRIELSSSEVEVAMKRFKKCTILGTDKILAGSLQAKGKIYYILRATETVI